MLTQSLISGTGERPDIKGSGAGYLMSDVTDSRESTPSTIQYAQLTQANSYSERERRPPKHLDDYATDLHVQC